MRRQHQVKKYNLKEKPTFLYQLDGENLLIGTEGGKIEQRIDDKNTCDEPLRTYEAHTES